MSVAMKEMQLLRSVVSNLTKFSRPPAEEGIREVDEYRRAAADGDDAAVLPLGKGWEDVEAIGEEESE